MAMAIATCTAITTVISRLTCCLCPRIPLPQLKFIAIIIVIFIIIITQTKIKTISHCYISIISGVPINPVHAHHFGSLERQTITMMMAMIT